MFQSCAVEGEDDFRLSQFRSLQNYVDFLKRYFFQFLKVRWPVWFQKLFSFTFVNPFWPRGGGWGVGGGGAG